MEENVTTTMGTEFKNDLICRVCLSRGEEMQALCEDISIIGHIEFCTGLLLTLEPNLPAHICHPCLSHLQTAHSFKTVCLTSQQMLTGWSTAASHTQQEVPQSSLMSDVKIVTVKIEREESLDAVDVGDGSSDEWVEKVRKSKKVKMKKERGDSPEKKPKVYIRGPYKKSKKTNPRRPKLKFRRLYCVSCQLRFSSKAERDAHHAAVHADKEPKQWMCEICGKVFSHRGSHYTHVRSHLPPAHKCSACDYSTWHRSDLVKHANIHAGVKRYQCSICARSFRTSSNLTSHTRRLHELARPFACPQCPRRFFDGTKLRRHVDSHNDIKRFECEVCHSCFTRRCYWKKHLLKQHGVTVPAQRPGRQKVNFLVGQQLMLGTGKCMLTQGTGQHIKAGLQESDKCADELIEGSKN